MGRIIREEGEIFYGINFCFVRARRWSNRTGRERRGGGGEEGSGGLGIDGKTEDLGKRERGGGSVRETPIVKACVLLLARGEWQKGDEALM
jgi:hypothetical protein